MLGPVTYIVEIEDGGQRWKRHIDQLKEWLAPASSNSSSSQTETHPEQSEQFFPDSYDPPSNADAADPTNLVIEEQETPEPEHTDPVTPPEEPAESGSETVARRYPARNRQPPDFYHLLWSFSLSPSCLLILLIFGVGVIHFKGGGNVVYLYILYFTITS